MKVATPKIKGIRIGDIKTPDLAKKKIAALILAGYIALNGGIALANNNEGLTNTDVRAATTLVPSQGDIRRSLPNHSYMPDFTMNTKDGTIITYSLPVTRKTYSKRQTQSNGTPVEAYDIFGEKGDPILSPIDGIVVESSIDYSTVRIWDPETKALVTLKHSDVVYVKVRRCGKKKRPNK